MVDILDKLLSMLDQCRGSFNWWFQTITGVFLDMEEWNLQNRLRYCPPSQGNGSRTSSAFVHCFVLPEFLGGFSISLVNIGNGWNRPQKDKMVILRLEEYFPKRGKHTIEGGYQKRFYTVWHQITFKQWKHFSFFNSHLIPLRTFWGKSWSGAGTSLPFLYCWLIAFW